jgi:hypothetical protein
MKNFCQAMCDVSSYLPQTNMLNKKINQHRTIGNVGKNQKVLTANRNGIIGELKNKGRVPQTKQSVFSIIQQANQQFTVWFSCLQFGEHLPEYYILHNSCHLFPSWAVFRVRNDVSAFHKII